MTPIIIPVEKVDVWALLRHLMQEASVHHSLTVRHLIQIHVIMQFPNSLPPQLNAHLNHFARRSEGFYYVA